MRLIYGSYEKAIGFCNEKIKEDFFVFDFPFVPMSENFREINRFLWESRRQLAPFRNRYEGRAVIDVSEWNRHGLNDYFDAFIYFLKDRESYLNCTLISSEPFSDRMIAVLSRLFDITTVTIDDDRDRPAEKRVIGFTAEEVHQ